MGLWILFIDLVVMVCVRIDCCEATSMVGWWIGWGCASVGEDKYEAVGELFVIVVVEKGINPMPGTAGIERFCVLTPGIDKESMVTWVEVEKGKLH